MRINIVAALAQNRVIGQHNTMPWHLPADLKHFRAITINKPVIMGRKTFDSIGRPLPQRRNIVISRQANLNLAGCELATSLSEALRLAHAEEEVMIIGGAQIYSQALPLADRLYLTLIAHIFAGDAYFPAWQEEDWQEIERITHQAESKQDYNYAFVVLDRIRK